MQVIQTIAIVAGETNIWDRCEALSSPNRFWVADQPGVTLGIDTSVKSPIGTGSVKLSCPPTSGLWDLYVDEWFNADASLLLDFTLSRPRSVFVLGSKTVDWRVEVVTREPDGQAWNPHAIASQTVPANVMTEIFLDYSGIPDSALKMVGAVSVIVAVAQQEFTGYISGVTTVGAAPPQALTPSVTITPSPKGYPSTDFGFNVSWEPNNASTYEIRVDWGDQSPVQSSMFSGTGPFTSPFVHQYANPGAYVVAVQVADTVSGSAGVGSTGVIVSSLLTMTFTADKTSGQVPLTTTFTFSFSGGYPGYTWNLDPGDGSPPISGGPIVEGTYSQTYMYVAPGAYTATLTVSDSMGLALSGTASVAVRREAVGVNAGFAVAIVVAAGAVALVYLATRKKKRG